jgi:hypothetical protein
MDSIIPNTTSIKFLGLLLDKKLTWKAHSRELSIKLNKVRYAIRAIKSLVSLKVLISIYFSYFHSLLTYDVIFWGNSPISKDIFKIQKRVITIITNNPRHNLFKWLKILTPPSQYIFSVLVFIAGNRDLFMSNRDIHSFNTKTALIYICRLLIWQSSKGVCCTLVAEFLIICLYKSNVILKIYEFSRKYLRIISSNIHYTVWRNIIS